MLDPYGAVIPGLYAAGTVSSTYSWCKDGGFHIADAIVFGGSPDATPRPGPPNADPNEATVAGTLRQAGGGFQWCSTVGT